MAQAGDFFITHCGQALFNLVAPPLPTNLYMAAFTDSAVLPLMATRAPSSKKACAHPKPIPRLPPVINTRLSLNSMDSPNRFVVVRNTRA